jgi:hypothetical protein
MQSRLSGGTAATHWEEALKFTAGGNRHKLGLVKTLGLFVWVREQDTVAKDAGLKNLASNVCSSIIIIRSGRSVAGEV